MYVLFKLSFKTKKMEMDFKKVLTSLVVTFKPLARIITQLLAALMHVLMNVDSKQHIGEVFLWQ